MSTFEIGDVVIADYDMDRYIRKGYPYRVSEVFNNTNPPIIRVLGSPESYYTRGFFAYCPRIPSDVIQFLREYRDGEVLVSREKWKKIGRIIEEME